MQFQLYQKKKFNLKHINVYLRQCNEYISVINKHLRIHLCESVEIVRVIYLS